MKAGRFDIDVRIEGILIEKNRAACVVEDARLRPNRLRTIRLRPAGRNRIGRSRNWPKSKLAEVEIGRSRN